MWNINIDEPLTLAPKRQRPSRARTWLMRGGFLALHLALILGVLAWFGGWPPFLKRGPGAAPPPPTTKSAPPPAPRPAPRPAPVPSTAPGSVTPVRSTTPRAASRPESGPSTRRDPAPPEDLSRTKGESFEELREGTPPEARESSPEQVLRQNGLERSGGTFVLGGEAEADRQLARARATIGDYRMIVVQLAEIFENDAWIVDLTRQRVAALNGIRYCQNMLDSIPSGGNNIIVDNYQSVKAQSIAWKETYRVVDHDLQGRIGIRPDGARRQELEQNKGRLETSFREDVYELRRVVDATDAGYRELAQAEDVKDALREVKQKVPNVKIGPSDRFGVIRQELAKAERELTRR